MIQRRTSLIVMAVLAAALLLYGGGWLYVAHRVAAHVESWAEIHRARGWQIDYDGVVTEGFPFNVAARIDNPKAVTPYRTQEILTAPELHVRFSPFDPRRVTMTAPKGAEVAWTGAAPGKATLGDATVTVRLDGDGRMKGATLLLDNVTAASLPAAEETRINRVRATLTRGGKPDPRVPSHRRIALALNGELLGLTLPEVAQPGLGRTISRIALDAELLGQPAPALQRAAMAAWRDGGGTAEVKKFTLGWGPLTAEGDGTLALDAAMQPEGALTARITGFEKTVETLVEAGVVPARHGVLLGYALNALAKTPEGGGPRMIEAPISVQNSRLFIGPVALMPLPRIDWK